MIYDPVEEANTSKRLSEAEGHWRGQHGYKPGFEGMMECPTS